MPTTEKPDTNNEDMTANTPTEDTVAEESPDTQERTDAAAATAEDPDRGRSGYASGKRQRGRRNRR